MKTVTSVGLVFFVMFCGDILAHSSTCVSAFDRDFRGFRVAGNQSTVRQVIDTMNSLADSARERFWFNRSFEQIDALKVLPLIEQFTQEQLNQMTIFQVLNYGKPKLRALQKLTPENIDLLNKEIPQHRQLAMNPEEIASFSEHTVANIKNNLTYRTSNRKLKGELEVLYTMADNAMSDWKFTQTREKEENVAKYKVMRTFTGEQKDYMTTKQLWNLNPDQLRALQKLTPENIDLLNEKVPLRKQMAMSPEEIASFSEQALSTMEIVTFKSSNESLNDLVGEYRLMANNGRESWQFFRDTQYDIAIAKDDIMLKFTGPQKDKMTAKQLWNLNPDQLRALQKLTPENIDLLNEKVPLRKQMAMSPEEIASFFEQNQAI